MVRIVKFLFGRYMKNFSSSQLLLTCSENIDSNNNNKSKNKQTKTFTTLKQH